MIRQGLKQALSVTNSGTRPAMQHVQALTRGKNAHQSSIHLSHLPHISDKFKSLITYQMRSTHHPYLIQFFLFLSLYQIGFRTSQALANQFQIYVDGKPVTVSPSCRRTFESSF